MIYWNIFLLFPKTDFDSSCKLSQCNEDNLHECQILSSGLNKAKYHQFVVLWICPESGKGYSKYPIICSSNYVPSTHLYAVHISFTRSVIPVDFILSSLSFSINGIRWPTAFFITRADLITWGRNILPAPNKSPTIPMPCRKKKYVSSMPGQNLVLTLSLP